MLEKHIEKYLCKKVKQVLHGKAYKWVSPGNNGVPDRLVILPGGIIVLAELKAPGKELRLTQKIRHAELIALGCTVLTIDTKDKVDDFIAAYSKHV